MGFQPVRARNYRLSRLFGLASLAKRETILDQTAERSAPFDYRRETCLVTKDAGVLPVRELNALRSTRSARLEFLRESLGHGPLTGWKPIPRNAQLQNAQASTFCPSKPVWMNSLVLLKSLRRSIPETNETMSAPERQRIRSYLTQRRQDAKFQEPTRRRIVFLAPFREIIRFLQCG